MGKHHSATTQPPAGRQRPAATGKRSPAVPDTVLRRDREEFRPSQRMSGKTTRSFMESIRKKAP